MSTPSVSPTEIERQYRVARQFTAMHAALRARYERRSLLLDLALLASSIVFCATTFPSDTLFQDLGFSVPTIRLILSFASLLAFFASMAALVVDWKGKASRHGDAANRLARVVSDFRMQRLPDGSWPEEARNSLHRIYGTVWAELPPVSPENFLPLKSAYLREVQLSELVDRHPACPQIFLRVILLWVAVAAVWRSRAELANRISEGA